MLRSNWNGKLFLIDIFNGARHGYILSPFLFIQTVDIFLKENSKNTRWWNAVETTNTSVELGPWWWYGPSRWEDKISWKFSSSKKECWKDWYGSHCRQNQNKMLPLNNSDHKSQLAARQDIFTCLRCIINNNDNVLADVNLGTGKAIAIILIIRALLSLNTVGLHTKIWYLITLR